MLVQKSEAPYWTADECSRNGNPYYADPGAGHQVYRVQADYSVFPTNCRPQPPPASPPPPPRPPFLPGCYLATVVYLVPFADEWDPWSAACDAGDSSPSDSNACAAANNSATTTNNRFTNMGVFASSIARAGCFHREQYGWNFFFFYNHAQETPTISNADIKLVCVGERTHCAPSPPPQPPPAPPPPEKCANDPAAYTGSHDPDGVFTPLNDWERDFHAAYCNSVDNEAECERTICGTSYGVPAYVGTMDITHRMCVWITSTSACIEKGNAGQTWSYGGTEYDVQCDCADFAIEDCPGPTHGCIRIAACRGRRRRRRRHCRCRHRPRRLRPRRPPTPPPHITIVINHDILPDGSTAPAGYDAIVYAGISYEATLSGNHAVSNHDEAYWTRSASACLDPLYGSVVVNSEFFFTLPADGANAHQATYYLCLKQQSHGNTLVLQMLVVALVYLTPCPPPPAPPPPTPPPPAPPPPPSPSSPSICSDAAEMLSEHGGAVTHVRLRRCDPAGVTRQRRAGQTCETGAVIKTNCYNIDKAYIESQGMSCSDFIGRTMWPCPPDENGVETCTYDFNEPSNNLMWFEYCGDHPTWSDRCRSAFSDGVSVASSTPQIRASGAHRSKAKA